MKAQYIIPVSEVMHVASFAVMQNVSGPDGLKDGGKDQGSAVPRAPQKPF